MTKIEATILIIAHLAVVTRLVHLICLVTYFNLVWTIYALGGMIENVEADPTGILKPFAC